MQPYHLAKLVDWARTLNSRKRLQKVVYLLNAAGCKELDAPYFLHHYGPYSAEVASLADQLVRIKLVEEIPEANGLGVQYSYRVSETGRQQLQQFEASDQGKTLASFCGWEEHAKKLLHRTISDLEYGATMVYFYRQTGDWDRAVDRTCQMKKIERNGSACAAALKLAQEIALHA